MVKKIDKNKLLEKIESGDEHINIQNLSTAILEFDDETKALILGSWLEHQKENHDVDKLFIRNLLEGDMDVNDVEIISGWLKNPISKVPDEIVVRGIAGAYARFDDDGKILQSYRSRRQFQKPDTEIAAAKEEGLVAKTTEDLERN